MSEDNQIKDLFNNSGNKFHYDVVNWLRSNNWTVQVSPYFSDNITNKPREVDIRAEKEYGFYTFGEKQHKISVQLFIECKYIKDKTLFWLDEVDNLKLSDLITRTTILGDPSQYSSTKQHRYFNTNKVAKLFDSQSQKNSDNDVIYKALNQSLNATICFRDTKLIRAKEHPLIQYTNIYYPVILCNSFENFYSCNVLDNNKIEPVKDNFLFEINYAFNDSNSKIKNEYFLVDIVDFKKINEFITNLENMDIETIKKKLDWA